MSQAPRFRHLVIRASAGTGKTHQLAVRFLGLLAAGTRPDEILATTFTRKAAGEILDRIFSRLAEAAASDGRCRQLAQDIATPDLSREQCTALLAQTLRQLHALRIGTLDSYFIQVATCFGQELGLPPGWSICDEQFNDAVREEAIEAVLTHASSTKLLALVHALSKGEATRSVSRMVNDTVSGLFELYRETTPDAWKQIPHVKGLSPAERQQLLAELAAFPLSDSRLQKARDADVERARLEQWRDLIDKGLAGKVLGGTCEYYKKPLPDGLVALYRRLLKHVESVLLTEVALQTEATHDLLQSFAEQYRRLQLDERVLRFGDVTYQLASAAGSIGPGPLAYRLNGSVRHILLDEFQDTSPLQWRVLRPLARHVAADERGSLFCVGDVKQAIYGWRGGLAEIFDAVTQELPGLSESQLNVSYRSSPPVIDAVNRVFQNLTQHPNLERLAEPVARWQAVFPEHATARIELPGHVALVTGPEPAEDESAAEALFSYAAEQVRSLHQKAPQASLAVLVRTNDAVAHLIYLLRKLGVPASEEGGNPLVDSAAVELLLSLLKLADHPGDRVARFHIATSPLAEAAVQWLAAAGIVLAAPFDERNDAAAAALSELLRRQLFDEGYGATVHAWARRLAPVCDARDLDRLQQLVELAYSYQPTSSLRADDFLRLVEQERVADPSAAAVRVMTVHQAKGLQFDIVVLPELEKKLTPQTPPIVCGRSPTEPVQAVCRYAEESVRRFFPPRLAQLFDETTRREVHESLCLLYVAMTRAVHALHLVIAPAQPVEKNLPKTFAGLLRATLAPDKNAGPEQTLYQHGDHQWFRACGKDAPAGAQAPPAAMSHEPLVIRLAPPVEQPQRGLARVSPSSLEGGLTIRAARVLAPRADRALDLGTLVHAWMETIAWLDDGLPSDETLRQVALRLRMEIGDVSDQLPRLIEQFRQQIAVPGIAAALSRGYYAKPGRLGLVLPRTSAPRDLAVKREWRFITRHAHKLVKGSIDRLVLLQSGGRIDAADILDFKTDELPRGDRGALAKRVEYYRPQIESYRLAVSEMLALPPERVAARLLFLHAGEIVALPLPAGA